MIDPKDGKLYELVEENRDTFMEAALKKLRAEVSEESEKIWRRRFTEEEFQKILLRRADGVPYREIVKQRAPDDVPLLHPRETMEWKGYVFELIDCSEDRQMVTFRLVGKAQAPAKRQRRKR